MNIGAIVGVGIVGAILAITVKNTRPEFGIGVSSLTGCIIFFAVLPHISDVLNEIQSISEHTGVDFDNFSPLVKIIGISYITPLSAEIIRDSGENAIAKKVELAGKVGIMIMLLPILKRLVAVVLKTFSML